MLKELIKIMSYICHIYIFNEMAMMLKTKQQIKRKYCHLLQHG